MTIKDDILSQLIIPLPANNWTKPATGNLEYILHREPDNTWRIVRLKAGLPEDKTSLRAILQSALDAIDGKAS